MRYCLHYFLLLIQAIFKTMALKIGKSIVTEKIKIAVCGAGISGDENAQLFQKELNVRYIYA